MAVAKGLNTCPISGRVFTRFLMTETVNLGLNKFYDTATWGECYKTFYGRNKRIFMRRCLYPESPFSLV
jgi:hypothetical protein